MIMDMTRATIIEKNINNNLWPEVVLAMTHVKNIQLTRALEEDKTPHQIQYKEPPNLRHLRIFGSTVYVLIHEEEHNLKSEK